MKKFIHYVYIQTTDTCQAWPVEGIEPAYEAYRKAAEFAGLIGGWADLVDGETGEVLESTQDWE